MLQAVGLWYKDFTHARTHTHARTKRDNQALTKCIMYSGGQMTTMTTSVHLRETEGYLKSPLRFTER